MGHRPIGRIATDDGMLAIIDLLRLTRRPGEIASARAGPHSAASI